MEVDCVLSSGAVLFKVPVNPVSTVESLQSKVTALLREQQAYSWKPEGLRIVKAFKSTPWEGGYETLAVLRTFRPLLYLYRGQLLSSATVVSGIGTEVCVLRPSDLQVCSIDLQGNITPSIYNICEEIEWISPAPLPTSQSPVLQLLVLTSTSNHALCQATLDDTVHSLKHRLALYLNIPVDSISLWHHDLLLSGDQVLGKWGLRQGSRLLAVQGEQLGYAFNANCERTVFPVTGKMSALRYLQVLEPGWSASDVRTYGKLFPVSDMYKYYLVLNKSSRFITLSLSHKASTLALLPLPCSLHTAKVCISSQHNLPIELVALTLATALDVGKTAKDYGLKEKEVIVASKGAIKQWNIELTLSGKKRKHLVLKANSGQFVSEIKAILLQRKPKLGSNVSILRGRDVLQDSKTLGDYGLPEHCSAKITSLQLNSPLTLIHLGLLHFVPPEAPRQNQYSAPEFSMDLFDPGQDLKALTKAQRLQRYSDWLQEPAISVNVVAPRQVLYVKVHKEATTAVIKAHLRLMTQEKGFKLIHNEKELEEGKRLEEQGIGQEATLLLIPPEAILISVQTAGSSQVFPIVLHTNCTLQGLHTAIPPVPGLPPHHQSYTYAKRLTDEEDPLPAAVTCYELWLSVGKGAEASLRTAQGTVLKVEGDPRDSEKDLSCRLEGKGLPGDFQLSVDL